MTGIFEESIKTEQSATVNFQANKLAKLIKFSAIDGAAADFKDIERNTVCEFVKL